MSRRLVFTVVQHRDVCYNRRVRRVEVQSFVHGEVADDLAVGRGHGRGICCYGLRNNTQYLEHKMRITLWGSPQHRYPCSRYEGQVS